jgi:hypothetical protein
VEAEAFAQLLKESVCGGKDAVAGDAREVVGMDGFLVVEAREKDLEEVFADGGQSPFGGKIRAVDIVHPPGGAVGGQNFVPDFGEVEFHQRLTLGASRSGCNREACDLRSVWVFGGKVFFFVLSRKRTDKGGRHV